jgi:hypothetical protein
MELYGDSLAQKIAKSITAPTATLTTLEAIDAERRVDGIICTVLSDQSQWQFVLASTTAAGTDCKVPDDIEASAAYISDPATAPGRWLRVGSFAANGSSRVHAAVADATALAAIVAADRANGMVIVKLDDYTLWVFESGSSASASNWVVVPGAGTGRWVRRMQSRADVLYPADVAAIKAIAAVSRFDGLIVTKADDGSRWRFVAASVLTTDGDQLLIIPTAGTGVWVRQDKSAELSLAATFASADAAVLYTVPAGFRLKVGIPYWNVTTSWTGGTDSAIGLSSSNSALTTKGDLLGGAAGDLAATLLSTGAYAKGTIGAKALAPGMVLVAGETIRFDRIASVFTAGAGTAKIPVQIVASP